MTTIFKSGLFGDMALNLEQISDKSLRLSVLLKIGNEELGASEMISTAHLKLCSSDIQSMLDSIEMLNSLPSGLGRTWRFIFSGNFIPASKSDGDEPEDREFLSCDMKLTPVRPMQYSHYRLEREGTPRFLYEGTVSYDLINLHLDSQALDSRIRYVGTEVNPAEIDLVTYLRERNPASAADYCPQVSNGPDSNDS